MKHILRGTGSSCNLSRVLARAFVVAGFLLVLATLPVQAGGPGGFNSAPTNTPLDSWSFEDSTYWTSDYGYAPVSFTNLAFSSLGNGASLVVDTNIPAWLNYNVYESDGTTNLIVNYGTLTFWFAPGSWSSTNAGGTGPGEYGRLFEVGSYTTNSSYGWWSVYVDSGGNNLFFSAQTNDLSSNITTYVTAPISWTNNYFHFIALTYSPTNTSLYLDGALATNGPGVTVYPGTNVLANGFCIGSDTNGVWQAHGMFNMVQTFGYPLSSNDVQTFFDWYYGYYMINPYNTSYSDSSSSQGPLPSSTNLWLNPISISNNLATLFLMNSTADILYEIQCTTNLSHPQWTSDGFISGSELTNLTAASLAVGKSGNLFLRIRNWEDDTGTGIPDWWWLQYFGQITNVNAFAEDAAGDGYTDLQKFQMGLNPTNYYNPSAPTNFAGCFDATGTNVFLEWTPAPGPVANYLIQRGVLNTNTGNYAYTPIGTASSNADYYEDIGAISNNNAGNNIYTLEAAYQGGNITATDTWHVSWYVNSGEFGLPFGPAVPGNVYAYADAAGTNVLLSWTPATGTATNYLIKRGVFNYGTSTYNFSQVGNVNITSNTFEVFGTITNLSNWTDEYEVVAGNPGGGLSQPITTYINVGSNTNGQSAPTPFYGYTDSSGTNINLAWGPSGGTATNYILLAGNFDGITYGYDYVQLGKVSSSTNIFKVVGAVDSSGNSLYGIYSIEAVYPGGGLSQAASWYPWSGTPSPPVLSAYLDTTGTNVVLAWTPVPSGASGYVIKRSGNYGTTFSQISTLGSSTLTYQDNNGLASAIGGAGSMEYEVQATYPNGGVSPPTTATISSVLPAPSGLSVTVDPTGADAIISWTPAVGNVTGYNILRGAYSASTGGYNYSQIGSVGSTTTSFQDTGIITGNNINNYIYEVQAVYSGSRLSPLVSSPLYTASPIADDNISVTAQMVRNQTGRWQLMFSAFPTNVTEVQLYITPYDYEYDELWGGDNNAADWFNNQDLVDTIPVGGITNGIFVIPDSITTNEIGNNEVGRLVGVHVLGTSNTVGVMSLAGFLPYDAPCFVDGRQHLKQNLLFELRGATISQNVGLDEHGVWFDPFFMDDPIPADTNYVESSFFHYGVMFKGYDTFEPSYVEMDDLWPFTVNYDLNTRLYNTNYTGASSFVWQTNLVTVPASTLLGIGDPYWISQSVMSVAINPLTGLPGLVINSSITNLAGYTNSGNLYLQSGINNLFGLSFTTALVNQNPKTTLALGGSTGLTNANCFFSQTADPSLQIVSYYFAAVNTPGTALPGDSTPNQQFPLPMLTGFASTNQTGLLVASVGNPVVIGGWAKEQILNGSSTKYAYLGQYFVTNGYFIKTNGAASTNTTGVVSPYGDFFPTDPGAVGMVTMPDIDTSLQATNLVHVISLNVDANHDGTMNFSYNGPDFVSPSKPFRFWANDVNDAGDVGGDGIPGGNGSPPDGTLADTDGNYLIQGSRNLMNFFPVYLNIGSLFQSNVLSAGISVTDTNYQFVLSQADGALRFAYTDLTPTNYMNFLRDTNEVFNYLNDAPLTTISNLNSGGVPVAGYFLNTIAGNNGGIILVEAWEKTTQPLVLTIYHGTNQIAQTSLPLSVSGVEQMFRSKTILLNPESGTVPDRLTDADVPNEPDTTDMNFIFVHGYNVNPQQARGWDADFYKRMYWSGSHAKFYGVTWEGSDSQILNGNVTIDLQTNIVNAFTTAPLLNTFLNSLSGTNVVAAHSLGNMLVLSTLNDCSNQSINTYFMIDAAVTINAIDTSVGSNPDMYPSAWTNYNGNLWASDWYGLFPTNDYRSSLTWWGRLSNLQNASVYNFYSSGEEVLRDYPTDPPPYLLGIAAGQLVSLWKGDTGEYTWAWQEKLKGLMPANFLLSSDHGGWQFNEAYETYAYLGGSYYWEPASPTTAAALTTSQLQTNAFFNFATQTGFVLFTNDLALESSSGSSYAQANGNRILSDAIPCLTLPLGANADTNLDVEFGGTRNFNMQSSYENSWPLGRGAGQYPAGTPFGEWHHSDVRAVAYTFTYKLFNQMVTVGNLK